MKTYTCYDAPLKVFGVPFFEENKKFERLPLSLREKLTRLDFLGRRCPGARVGFRTDAAEFTVRVSLKTLSVDLAMSLYSCQSVVVMIGDRQNAELAGLVNPTDYEGKTFEKTFTKEAEMQEVTLWLPRNEELENVEVIVSDDATVLEPTPYKYGKALYYGSSITEGGCCTSVVNGYNALLSRWLDLDYYNFGFSGNARGEIELAQYISTIDMSLFVLDYDHNAPSTDHLSETHEQFYRCIRESKPSVPILMLSRPNFYGSLNNIIRRQIIENTYNNALKSGDKNVYYIDGEALFGNEDRTLCTVDRTHPNDLGFYRMAKCIMPTMKKMLGIE